MITGAEMLDMSGRVALVTGGAGLLGRQFAAALLGAGATVHLVDIAQPALERAAEAISPESDDTLQTHVFDITDPAATERNVMAIAAAGKIDVLVNSAAIDPKFEPAADGSYADNGAFTGYSLENWKRSLDVNLTGMFLMTQAVCRVMEKTETGSVINISSTYGLTGPDQRIYEGASNPRFFKPVDYATTKAGVLGFTRAVAAFYQGTAIRVNALVPGGAYNNHTAEFERAYSSRTILGRMAQPDEYRGAILFLASDASSYMTGATLVVDGGWTAL